jgi:hypothetical protein
MKLPAVSGVIRRRILVNFRVDPAVMQPLLPAPFRPKLVGGAAIAGVCLIRLERLRPRFLPPPFGMHSENAAHRVAVCWTDEGGAECEGVYVPRRDTDSLCSSLAGGRLFPGEQQHARFTVMDEEGVIDFALQSDDGQVTIRLRGRTAQDVPATSVFPSVGAASDFFEAGSLGYSATSAGDRLDGMCLCTQVWHIEPLRLDSVYSSYFADELKFPKGSVEFDSAFLMRNIPHEWQSVPDLRTSSGRINSRLQRREVRLRGLGTF